LEINALGKFVIFCAGGACFPGSFGASGIFPAIEIENGKCTLIQINLIMNQFHRNIKQNDLRMPNCVKYNIPEILFAIGGGTGGGGGRT
jgi:hypothetical protein